jgi:hypothetical protein
MIINRLTKMHHYISCTTTKEDISVEKTIRLLINHVWKLHELSNTIIFDRDSQFISFVWNTICKILKINVKLFIVFHSKTDDQSEIVNQKMKRYLRSYCNYQQNDWFEWLFMTEFVSNVATSTFTKLFVFMINYEFESRMSFDSLLRLRLEHEYVTSSHRIVSLRSSKACSIVSANLRSIKLIDSAIMLRLSASESRNEQKISTRKFYWTIHEEFHFVIFTSRHENDLNTNRVRHRSCSSRKS